ncbi:protein of unknown function [Streptomyces sp. KY75]|nr:protein of unknown function [Streptomyces sp. KY75]
MRMLSVLLVLILFGLASDIDVRF